MPKPVALHTPRSLNIIVTQVCKKCQLPLDTMHKPVILHTQRSLNIIATEVCKEGQFDEHIIVINLISTDYSVT